MAKKVSEDVPRFDEPVKLARASDARYAELEDALVGLADAQAQLKEARVILKQAQAAHLRSMRSESLRG